MKPHQYRLIRFFNTFEPVTTFYRDLLPHLAECGFKIEVYISGTEYRKGRSGLEAALSNKNIEIRYVTKKKCNKHKGVLRIPLMISYIWNSILRTFFDKNKGFNFFLTQPPLFLFWGMVLKRLRGEPYACLVMDLYPDIAVKDGLFTEKSIIVFLLKKISRVALKEADVIFVIGRCMRDLLYAEGIPKEKIQVIHNWADEKLIFPVSQSRNKLRIKNGISTDDFVVMYSGNMGVSHDFKSFIEVILKSKNISKLKFALVGDGSKKKLIQREVKGLTNTLILPYQPLKNLSESLSMGDVHYVSLREGFDGLVVPSKTYGAFAVGRPVIFQGPETSEVARLIKENKCGRVVKQGDSNQLIQSVLEYYHDRKSYRNACSRALKVSYNITNRKNALITYYSVIEKVMKKYHG
jgi:colanic acid biosynthesis glycosyl transferase WcaI